MFKKIEPKQTYTWGLLTEERYSVRANQRNGFMGVVRLPRGVIAELGWQDGISLDILIGDGGDLGWFQLKPAATAYRAKLVVKPNGSGKFQSAYLRRPDVGVTASMTPETRLEKDNDRMGILMLRL